MMKKSISNIFTNNINCYYKIDGDKLRSTNTKNHTYCRLHDLINLNDLDFDNILLDEKSYESIKNLYMRVLKIMIELININSF